MRMLTMCEPENSELKNELATARHELCAAFNYYRRMHTAAYTCRCHRDKSGAGNIDQHNTFLFLLATT